MRYKTIVKEVKNSKLYRNIAETKRSSDIETYIMNCMDVAIQLHKATDKASVDILNYKVTKYAELRKTAFNGWYDEHVLGSKEDLWVTLFVYFILDYSDDVVHNGELRTLFNKYLGNNRSIYTFLAYYGSQFDVIPNPIDQRNIFLSMLEVLKYESVERYDIIEQVIKYKIEYYE